MDVDWTEVALFLGLLVPSIVLHEVAHGVAANLLGDDTAKRAGRLTLNPIRHVDPFGTILLPLMLALSGLGAFGYAKPVPVNVSRLRDPRQHALYVSLAGPATNLAIAGIAAVAFRLFAGPVIIGDDISSHTRLVIQALFFLGFLNVLLALFNLLPIPPLDGSALVERVLPHRWWPGYLRVRQFAMIGVIVLFLTVPEVPGLVFDPAVDLWLLMVD